MKPVPLRLPAWFCCLGFVLLAACAATKPGPPRTLRVGPEEALTRPSQAAARVRDGDTVLIAPGHYADCAVWRANHITIAAEAGGAVVIDGTPCQGKALFVTVGRGITVRGITFRDARVPDHNGAGIRVEGADLTVEHCRFLNDEDGILTAPSPGSTLRIADSEFRGNGNCIGACAHGIYAGAIARLVVTGSRFADTRDGHHIKSRAKSTELLDNDITDGPQFGASYLVDISNGGDLLMRGNTMRKGPQTSNPTAAVVIGAEGATNPTHRLDIDDNVFVNALPAQTVFVRNLTATPASLVNNRLSGKVIPLEGPGSVR